MVCFQVIVLEPVSLLKGELLFVPTLSFDSADFQAIHVICFFTNYEVLYQFIFGNKTANTSETTSSLYYR